MDIEIVSLFSSQERLQKNTHVSFAWSKADIESVSHFKIVKADSEKTPMVSLSLKA